MSQPASTHCQIWRLDDNVVIEKYHHRSEIETHDARSPLNFRTRSVLPAARLSILTQCMSGWGVVSSFRDASLEVVPPLPHVRLLDGPFKNAQDRNLEYIMAMDPDRLLAPFLQEAGLPPKSDYYGNWEVEVVYRGTSVGHYISALSLMYASTGESGCARAARVHDRRTETCPGCQRQRLPRRCT